MDQRVVVCASNEDPHARSVAEGLAAAFEGEVCGPLSSLSGAQTALCLDPESLERCVRAHVPQRVAVFSRFDLGWHGSLDGADWILVPTESMKAALPASARRRAQSVGPLAPLGYAPAADRRALAEALKIASPDHSPAIAIVSSELLDMVGSTSLLLQLELVDAEVLWLFDVGRDVEAAAALRRAAAQHELRAALFADTPEAPQYWQLADLVITAPRSPHVLRALGVGAGMVLLSDGGSDLEAAAITETGAALRSDAVARLSVVIDQGLEEADQLRRAIASLDVRGSEARLVALVREGAGRSLPQGLPQGLEMLGSALGGHQAHTAESDHGASEREESLEAKIDRELEELRKRL